jgi:hypothetical protein
VTWKQIKEERDFYSIQFSPASALSKTPKVKMEQVEKLQKMGIIGPELAAEMLEFPDLEKAYGIATANRDDIEMITERAAERGEFDFYEVISIPELYKNVMNEIMRLDADEENEDILQNLVDFLHVLKGKIDALALAAQPPAPPPQAAPVILGQGNAPVPQGQNALAQGEQPEEAPVEPPPPPPAPSEDEALMKVIADLSHKLDMVIAAQKKESPPNLTVIVEKDGKKRVIRDAAGNVTGSEPIEEPTPAGVT